MRRLLTIFLGALALGSLLGLRAEGQDGPPQRRSSRALPTSRAPATARPSSASRPARRPPRDPFAPPSALRGATLPARAARPGVPAPTRDPLAALEIRALIVLSGGRVGAIVSVEDRRWIVRAGDRIPLQGLAAEVLQVGVRGLRLQLRGPEGRLLGQPREVRQ